MDPQLQRLVELWSRSLELGLDAGLQRELDGLLADGALVERFTQWQAAAAAGEAEPSTDTPRLDAAVRAAFRRRVALRRWMPWLVLTGLGAAGLLAWASLAGGGRTQALPMAVEPQPDAVTVAPALAAPAPPPTLGLPPGYGQRPSRRMDLGGEIGLEFTAPGVPVRVEVLDERGRCVRTLLQGTLAAGPVRERWDGKDDAGRPLPRGRYRLRARTYTQLLVEKVVELDPTP